MRRSRHYRLLRCARRAGFGPEHGDRFDFNQQFGPAENGLNARGGRQWIEFLLLVKGGALFVERGVIALDVAQVAGGADDVLPGGAFGLQQARDVVERPPRLRPEIADVNAPPYSSMLAVPEISRMASPFRVDAHTPRKRTGLGVVEGFVQDPVVGDGALFHRRLGDLLQYIHIQNHTFQYPWLYLEFRTGGTVIALM